MQTVRQIERFWLAGQYDRLARELLVARPEGSPRLQAELAQPAPAAALALIRLDELHQAHHPLAQKLIHAILRSQESDGGWGDPVPTAVCLKALLQNRGSGPAVDRALAYLADLQKNDGSWPNQPIRRLQGDPFTTAFILFHLAACPPFTHSIRLLDALNWLAQNHPKDEDCRRIWQRATLETQLAQFDTPKVN
jgi:hypothetical protein